MNINDFLKPGEMLVSPRDELLQYTGRIGDENGDPKMIFPCSSVKFHFRGTSASIVISIKKEKWSVSAGCIMDGNQLCFRLPDEGTVRIDLCRDMPDCDHMVTFFKRQDTCNTFVIHGIILSEGSELTECPERPKRRIEVYGDSVSAGGVCEAVEYMGRKDPEDHDGKYSNCWYAYSWVTARKLKSEIHNISQGGIALIPGTGRFHEPNLIGMEQLYDKWDFTQDDIDNGTKWDFGRYTPHVVIVAFGQNDHSPEDYMKEDINGEKAKNWREHYKAFLTRIREVHPKATIICCTTIFIHDAAWDKSIDMVVNELADKKIHHFMYTLNGCGTPGHIRIPEGEMMAQELTGFINSLGEEIWED